MFIYIYRDEDICAYLDPSKLMQAQGGGRLPELALELCTDIRDGGKNRAGDSDVVPFGL